VGGAYLYAEDPTQYPKPRELTLLESIQAYGAVNVLGRPLGAGEIRRMNLANSIVTAYRSWSQSDNWAKWREDNPAAGDLLDQARQIAEGMVSDGESTG
jgi:hypothetical protein